MAPRELMMTLMLTVSHQVAVSLSGFLWLKVINSEHCCFCVCMLYIYLWCSNIGCGLSNLPVLLWSAPYSPPRGTSQCCLCGVTVWSWWLHPSGWAEPQSANWSCPLLTQRPHATTAATDGGKKCSFLLFIWKRNFSFFFFFVFEKKNVKCRTTSERLHFSSLKTRVILSLSVVCVWLCVCTHTGLVCEIFYFL